MQFELVPIVHFTFLFRPRTVFYLFVDLTDLVFFYLQAIYLFFCSYTVHCTLLILSKLLCIFILDIFSKMLLASSPV